MVSTPPKKIESSTKAVVPVADLLPPTLTLLPVIQTTLFPGMILPLVIPEGELVEMTETALSKTGLVGISLVKNAGGRPVAAGPSTSMTGIPPAGTVPTSKAAGDLEFTDYGVVARILKKVNLPDNQISVLVTGLQRYKILKVISTKPTPVATVQYLYEIDSRDSELEAFLRSALTQFKELSRDNPLISEELKVALVNIDGPGKLADLMASVLLRDIAVYQELLATPDIKKRLQLLLVLLRKEQDVQSVQRKIHDEINQKVASSQREYYLQEQLKTIQRELGQFPDEKSRLIGKFKERLKLRTLNKDTQSRINEEFEKLSSLNEQSSEFSVAINYLDTVTSLPWGVRTNDRNDIRLAKKILEEDHYGLKEPKERLLEFLAVRKLKATKKGSILCLVGPPGTGKTSLGKSIARALDRKFFRFSVGGMRDEAEIKGHRRTYVGAMPGKIIQGLKRIGAQNPVFLIDEVDKLGTGMASGGDPASALLELLDTEQNKEFLDHYLDLPFDCSEIFFITTANSVETIPPALLDRMEVIELHGYTDIEKFHIAKKYLIPRQFSENALKKSQLKLHDKALRFIIARFARESGVRNLEKQIAKLCRKVAYKIATGQTTQIVLKSEKDILKYLGNPIFDPDEQLPPQPGVVTGLAWTRFGGDTLVIESVAVSGKAGIRLTGSLGEVMQESANIAYTYAREHAQELGLSPDYFEKHSLHLHVPAGATPKDGPSAGITMAASLASLLSKKNIKPGFAMTGELTLSGRVLPVGGIQEKLLAAQRAKIRNILLPAANKKDVQKIDKELRKGLQIQYVGSMKDVSRILF